LKKKTVSRRSFSMKIRMSVPVRSRLTPGSTLRKSAGDSKAAQGNDEAPREYMVFTRWGSRQPPSRLMAPGHHWECRDANPHHFRDARTLPS